MARYYLLGIVLVHVLVLTGLMLFADALPWWSFLLLPFAILFLVVLITSIDKAVFLSQKRNELLDRQPANPDALKEAVKKGDAEFSLSREAINHAATHRL